jgi:hypothetical protein
LQLVRWSTSEFWQKWGTDSEWLKLTAVSDLSLWLVWSAAVCRHHYFNTDSKAYFQTIEAFARPIHIAVFWLFPGTRNLERQYAVIFFAISINTVVVLLLLKYCSILLQAIYLRALWLNRLIKKQQQKKRQQ